MRSEIVLLLLGMLMVASSAPARDCRVPGADCRLWEAAEQAGIRIGAFRQAGPHPEEDAIVSAENDALTVPVYWTTTHPLPGVYDFNAADESVAFAEMHGLATRAHPLLWDQLSLDATPDWVTSITDPNELRALVREHINTVVGRYAGRIDAWDVVNEPIQSAGVAPYDNVFRQILGPGYIAEVLEMAYAADPNAVLFVNEIAVGLAPVIPAKVDAFLTLVRDLLTAGAPLHGVGFQGHFFVPSDAQAVFRALREVQEMGLVVELTEMDMPQRDDPDPAQRQRQEYFGVTAACLAVPACRRITIWGVSDANTWLDWFLRPGTNPLLFDTSFQPKPAYDGVRDALIAYIPRDLSGHRLELRDHATQPKRRWLRIVSRDPALSANGPVAFGDPTELGASLRLLNPESREEARFQLPSEGWSAMGPAEVPTGYRYRDRGGAPCTWALLRPGRKLVVRCKGEGIDFTLDEPEQGTLAVELRIGDVPRQCLEFGGTIHRDEGHDAFDRGRFRASAAPATTRCSIPATP